MSRFERLSPERDIQSFASGNNDLDSWLRDAAITADRAGTARVYLWLDDKERVIGYYAVVPHGIRREDVPSSVGRGAPDVIPGFLLARLALSEELHGQQLGGEPARRGPHNDPERDPPRRRSSHRRRRN